MGEPLDFDVHIQWLSIALRRICLFDKPNQKPLLSLTLNRKLQCSIYDKTKTFPEKLSLDDVKTGLPYVFIIHLMQNLPENLQTPNEIFPLILSTLKNMGYSPSSNCEVSNLINGNKNDHVELMKIIEWAVVDRSISISLICDDIKRLPRSFYILQQQPDLLEDAIALWLSKFPCSFTLPTVKNVKEEIFEWQHVAFSLSRVYPKRIFKDMINVGSEITELMISKNYELAKPVLEELMVFVPPKRSYSSPHLIYLFFADIFYATRPGAKKFVKLDPPPMPIIELKPFVSQPNTNEQVKDDEDNKSEINDQNKNNEENESKSNVEMTSGEIASAIENTDETKDSSKDQKENDEQDSIVHSRVENYETKDDENNKKTNSSNEESSDFSFEKAEEIPKSNNTDTNEITTKDNSYSSSSDNEIDSNNTTVIIHPINDGEDSNATNKINETQNDQNIDDKNEKTNQVSSSNEQAIHENSDENLKVHESQINDETNTIQFESFSSSGSSKSSKSNKSSQNSSTSDEIDVIQVVSNSENEKSDKFEVIENENSDLDYSFDTNNENRENETNNTVINQDKGEKLSTKNTQEDKKESCEHKTEKNKMHTSKSDTSKPKKVIKPTISSKKISKSNEGKPNEFSDGYIPQFSKNHRNKLSKKEKSDRIKFKAQSQKNDANKENVMNENQKNVGLVNTTPIDNYKNKIDNNDLPNMNHAQQESNLTIPNANDTQANSSEINSLSSSYNNETDVSDDESNDKKNNNLSDKVNNHSSDDKKGSHGKETIELESANNDSEKSKRKSSKKNSQNKNDKHRSKPNTKNKYNFDDLLSFSSSESRFQQSKRFISKTFPNELNQFNDELDKLDRDVHRLTTQARRHISNLLNRHSLTYPIDDLDDIDAATLGICMSQRDDDIGDSDVKLMKKVLLKFLKLPDEKRTIHNLKKILYALYNRQRQKVKNIKHKTHEKPEPIRKKEAEKKKSSRRSQSHIDRIFDKLVRILKAISGNPESIPQRLINFANTLFDQSDDDLLSKKDDVQSKSDDSIVVDELSYNSSSNSNSKSRTESQIKIEFSTYSETDDRRSTKVLATEEVQTVSKSISQTNRETQTDKKDFEQHDILFSSQIGPYRLFEPIVLFDKPSIQYFGSSLDEMKCEVSINHIPFRRFTSFNRSPPTLRNTTIISNYKIIAAIIRYNAMPAPQQDLQKNKLLNYLKNFERFRLIVLMTVMGLKFKGVYKMVSENGEITRIWGNGPFKISESDVGVFYKYITGSKQFEEIPTRHFTQTTDAITLKRKIEPRNW